MVSLCGSPRAENLIQNTVTNLLKYLVSSGADVVRVSAGLLKEVALQEKDMVHLATLGCSTKDLLDIVY